jgi:hypothetical protein
VGQWWASLYNDPNWFVFYGHDAIRNVKLTANTACVCVYICATNSRLARRAGRWLLLRGAVGVCSGGRRHTRQRRQRRRHAGLCECTQGPLPYQEVSGGLINRI